MALPGKTQGDLSGPAANVEHVKRSRVTPPCRRHEVRQLMPDDLRPESPVRTFEVRLIRGSAFGKGYRS